LGQDGIRQVVDFGQRQFLGSELLKTGGLGMPFGSTPPAALIAACTSCAAESMFRSRVNWSVMVAVPNALMEVICERPLIWPNCRSKGSVTEDAMTSGLAPGYWPTTWMVGKSTGGSAEMGKSS
jgi:hypothetical protein